MARAMSSCEKAGVGTITSSAPRTAAAMSALASANGTARVPRKSRSTMLRVPATGASAAASRRHSRTSCPCSDKSAAAA